MFEILSICKSGGYNYCRTNPKHPNQNSKGLYPLHRVIVENRIKRLLTSKNQVHHKDENKLNNDCNNLEVLSISEHTKIHAHILELIDLVCPYCGCSFKEKPRFVRLRKKRNKSGLLCCSVSCATKITYKLKNR